MTSHHSTRGGYDAPVSNQSDDLLNRWSVARAIDRVIANAPPGWSTRIGLYGPWGSGKTSVLRFLRTLTERRGDVVVELSAWQAHGEGGVIRLLHAELLKELELRKLKVEPLLARIKRKVASGASIAQGIGGAGAQAAGSVDGDVGQAVSAIGTAMNLASSAVGEFTKPSAADLEKLQRALGQLKVVVFVDDLDRADPKLVPKTLLALRELLDWPNFAFVLAFDKQVIARALGEYSTVFGQSADEFLEKVVDVPFDLPYATAAQVSLLAEQSLAAMCSFIPEDSRRRAAKLFPSNPRQAKQVVRVLSALETAALRHEVGELNWSAIALQTILRQAAPNAAALFEANNFGVGRETWTTQLERESGLAAVIQQILAADAQGRAGLAEHDHTRREWLARLLADIQLSRRSDSVERVHYEMRLLVQEPAFTHKEVRDLAVRVQIDPKRVDVSREIERSNERSNESSKACAEDLLRTALGHLGNANEQLERALTASRQATARGMLETSLRLVEHLWASDDVHVALVRGSLPTVQQVLAITSWLAARRETGDPDGFLAREVALTIAAATQCRQAWQLYFLATPTRSERGVAASTKYVLSKVRALAEPAVVGELVQMFEREDGLVGAFVEDAQREEHNLLWMLTEPHSPLYSPATKTLLINVLQRAGMGSARETENLVQNATRFLTTIAMMTTSESWITDFPAFAVANADLLTAAWQALLQQDEAFRSPPFLLRLLVALHRLGIPSTLFEIPSWLSDSLGLAKDPELLEIAKVVGISPIGGCTT